MQEDADMVDIEKIKTLLPHRYPFLLIDRVLEVEKGQHIKALKNITVNEPFFQGHFPGKSVMPGVLIIEALAQAAGLLGALGFEEGDITEDSLFYLVGIDKVRFRKPAGPGDQLILDVKFLALKRNIWKFHASAYVDSQLITSAELLTTVME
ncbi:MAG: 3-hydroxyacyl-[acyl-carrier-protein] dehydratase FabZ [marine bacterium B5-7]|nr:MAG: 3-hydroxyacyl-[acyl-carrier-protein] dehydratase FabZ [marine bacterium B5-7]